MLAGSVKIKFINFHLMFLLVFVLIIFFFFRNITKTINRADQWKLALNLYKGLFSTSKIQILGNSMFLNLATVIASLSQRFHN